MKVNPFTLEFRGSLEADYLEDYFHKSITHIRLALLLGIFLYALFGAIDIWIVPEGRSPIWFARFPICGLAAMVLWGTYLRDFQRLVQPLLSALVTLSGLVLLNLSILSPPLIRDRYHAGVLLLIGFSHTFIKLRFIYATAVSWTMTIATLLSDIWILRVPHEVLVNSAGYLLTANLIGMFASYANESYMRKDFIHDMQIKSERDKSERLLLNILPQAIAQQLKQVKGDESYTIADSFPEVTVLFADIVDFTKLSDRISPTDLVNWLNNIISAFDRLAEKYGLEKIKTIGDAYMVVGGLPLPRADHAEAIAEMALEMQEAIAAFNREYGETCRLRIGINTGPVVAGVIGIKKFIYDLWGDTVNTASRMESHSLPGCIQVTQETYKHLQEKYVFEERGVIEVKGKGMMTTYFLAGRGTNLDDSPLESL